MRISDWSSDVCSSDLCGRHLPEARLEAREGRGFTRLERPSPRSLVEIMMRQAAQNSLLRFSNSAQLLTSFGRFADRRLSAEPCQIAHFRADSRWTGKPHMRTLGTLGPPPTLGLSSIHPYRGPRTETPRLGTAVASSGHPR